MHVGAPRRRSRYSLRIGLAPVTLSIMPSLWQEIQERAFQRQHGRCGLCGDRLTWGACVAGDSGAWHAHHVDGDPTNDRLSNCVALCVDPTDSCHLYAHHGDFAGNLVIPKSDYPFWNG